MNAFGHRMLFLECKPGNASVADASVDCDSAQSPHHTVEKETEVTRFVCGHKYRGSCATRCAPSIELVEKMTERGSSLQ